mmetsp:Transcript_30011/g.38741  ORF Transcript_30011/g.38741 Transcript_30011/m.38741 type:complete len:1575 (+) Transcript_30011:1304-6028(+)
MYDIWKRFSMEKHSMVEVPLSKKNEAVLTETVKQYAEKKEIVIDGKSVERLFLPQIKYMFPAVPKKKGDQVKPLTGDQKEMNAIFVQQLKRRWLKKRDEVATRAAKISLSLLDQFLLKEQKSTSESARPSAADLKRKALYIMGIAKLSKWVEEDEDEKGEKLKEKAESKRHEASHAHEAFVRGKKALELHLPTGADSAPKPPRFVFATGTRRKGNPAVPVRSKQVNTHGSTVDMLRESGLRVVHALSAGKQGRAADLEKSREQLEKEGHISKHNYEDEEAYKAAVAKKICGNTLDVGAPVIFLKGKTKVNSVVLERTRSRFEVEDGEGELRVVDGEDLRKRGGEPVDGRTKLESGDKVVEGSKILTIVRDMSQYLVSITNEEEEEEEVLRKDLRLIGEAGLRQAAADDSYKEWIDQKRAKQLAGEFLKFIPSPEELKVEGELATVDEALAHWKQVGKHLKVIDRGLLDEWFEWSKAFEVSYYVCQVLWDSFEPIGDDVHTNYYSLARTTLAMLLRPGLKFQAAGDKIVHRKWRACEKRGEDLGDIDDATEEDLKTLKMFDRTDLKQLLGKVGLELRSEQLRLVVDSFDTDDEGKMHLDRFLEFTGPNGPTDRADANRRLRLQTPPVWESTCPKTGLSNAFRVTSVSEGLARQQGADEGRLVKIIEKKNGEKRQLVELKERKRRIAILKTFQELPEYDEEDDEEERYSDDDGEEKDGFNKKCTVAQWNADNGSLWKMQRRVSLKALAELSRSRRDEAELQSLMERGLPPVAPSFYAAGTSDPEVMDRRDPLERSLLLRWDSPPGSLVAFFSVEMSGPRGSKEQRENQFREVFRDPDSVRSPFGYSTWIHDLEPGTTYSLRIRAFNGFGPGPYTWKTFTTRPRCPNRPMMTARSPSSITLRWAGGEDTAERHLRDIESILKTQYPGFFECGREARGGTFMQGRSFIEAIDEMPTDIAFFFKSTKTEDGTSLRDNFECIDELNWGEVRSVTLKAASRLKGKAPSPATSQVRYNIEQCVSISTGQWVKVLTTKFDHATVSALKGGSTYRFRVYATNANGLESKKSSSCVYTTLLENPPAPNLVPSKQLRMDGMASLKVAWDPSAVHGVGLLQRDQRKQAVDRILNSWTQEGMDDEGAVNLRKTFRRQQTHTETEEDEFVSIFDLDNLLEDIGCDPGDAKKAEVLEVASSQDNSLISLSRLQQWWVSETVVYELKRDSGKSLDTERLTQERGSDTPINIVCYRGTSQDGRQCLVSGLEPNFTYRFTMKVATSRSQSSVSKVLEATTPPSPLDPPVIVCNSDPKTFSLKWYPPRNGSHRYVLEARLMEALDAVNDKHVQIASAKIIALGWRLVFDGRETFLRIPITAAAVAASGEGLLPNSVYQFRVTGVNSKDVNGIPSEAVLCRTPSRLSSMRMSMSSLRPANAHEHFTVECRGDVVVGDTIICTEQLMVDSNGKLAKGNRKLHQSRQRTKGQSHLTLVGERTIAAHVMKDVYRSPKHTQELGVSSSTSRILRLEVIWTTCSSEEAEVFLLAKGDIVERDEDYLAMFEMFRKEWADESKRLPEARERILFKRTKKQTF